MNTLSYKTQHANRQTVKHEWWLVDAEGKTLGRLATQIASVLIGKHKPCFTTHVDTGDHVVVINAEKVRMTGKKLTDKRIITYSGYPGGKKIGVAQIAARPQTNLRAGRSRSRHVAKNTTWCGHVSANYMCMPAQPMSTLLNNQKFFRNSIHND